MQISILPLSDLHPAKYNPRKISDAELDGLKQSIKKFGIVDPIIVNKNGNVIIGGHQRIHAAELLSITEVPCVMLDLSPTEEKALNIALNSPHLQGKYDDELLSTLLQEIKLELPEFEALRFDEFILPIIDYSEKNQEIDTENFGNDLQHMCPRCGMEFND